MKIIKGGITQPQGFKSNGIACGLKKSGKLDLGLITSDIPAVSSAVFTKSSIKAAPLLVCQEHIRNHITQAIVINSGNANCFTGKQGLACAQKTTELIGKKLAIPHEDVLVASTGIIGKQLSFTKIQDGAKKLIKGLSPHGADKTARAILTTDITTKEITVEITLSGKKVTIGACAKGSGMIAPNMATMLAFITTDAAISAKMLNTALKSASDQSFNCISVDGCMSTNDMVSVMANGLAKNKKITTANKDYKTFCNALNHVCLDLAKKIVLDGEGATKFIEIQVVGAKNYKQAQEVGLKVANSNLVKTAAYGNNPNWGRVAAAVGSVGIKEVTENKIKFKFSPFTRKHIIIHINLNIGAHKAVVYTSDLSYKYVKINVEYT